MFETLFWAQQNLAGIVPECPRGCGRMGH